MPKGISDGAPYGIAEGIRAVLFDLDGTLADTALDLGYALNQLRAQQGLDALPQSLIRPQASHGARGLLQVGFGVTPEHANFASLRAAFLEFYAQHICDHTRLFDGIADLLLALEQGGIVWGVVTNKPSSFTQPLMQKLGLDKRAACIISGDDAARPKPHPDTLIAAAACLNLPPQQCLYVGDAERDIAAARAAGMPALIAAYGYIDGEDQPENWGAQAIIARPEEVLVHLAFAGA